MSGATPQKLNSDLLSALTAGDASLRLRAALALGMEADGKTVDVLIERCAVEPDFYVRDMLTWAITRLPQEVTVPRLLTELQSATPQARSQALHTLSKIKDAGTWPAITQSLLRDRDDEVARSAWRAAVILVPADQRAALSTELISQLGRRGHEVQLSLSRALVALGPEIVEPALTSALASGTDDVRVHARATLRLLADPDMSFESAIHEAKRTVALGPDQKTTDSVE